MSASPAPLDAPPATVGRFNYLAPSVASSLYRNGAVLTRRDRDGSDSGIEGIVLAEHEMPVTNARSLAGSEPCSLARNGFELLERPLSRPELDFFDHEQVTRGYYDECAEIVARATDARHVAAFDHNVRSASGKSGKRRILGGQQVQGPAHLVHGDYTLRGAPERLRALARPPGGNDTLRSVLPAGEALLDGPTVERVLEDGRFAIVNLWRNIAPEPVRTHPLALCDAQSFRPSDLVVFEIHYRERVGENYFAKHAPGHRWFSYPAMTRDEALLIKQWDSAGPLARSGGSLADSEDADAPCTFSFHSAFEDPGTPSDAPDRWSIEVRCIVLYD